MIISHYHLLTARHCLFPDEFGDPLDNPSVFLAGGICFDRHPELEPQFTCEHPDMLTELKYDFIVFGNKSDASSPRSGFWKDLAIVQLSEPLQVLVGGAK